MAHLFVKHHDLKIRLYQTPLDLCVSIRKRGATSGPWIIALGWGQVRGTTPFKLATHIVSVWNNSIAEDNTSASLPDIIQTLFTLLLKSGPSFKGFSQAPLLADGGSWKEEFRIYMGKDGFAGFSHGARLQIRYTKQSNGLVRILPDYAPWFADIVITKQEFKEMFLSIEEITNKIFESRNNVRKKSKTICYNPRCPTGKHGVKSHILQQKGILSELVEARAGGNKIVELTLSNPYEQNRTGLRYGLRYNGVDSSNELAYWGFCSKCDTELFAEIEQTPSPDFTSLRSQLLLSYRAHLNELFKQEYNVLHWRAVRDDPYYPQYVKDIYKPKQIGQALACIHGYILKTRLEQAIDNPAISPFQFVYFTLPKVPIATSSIYASSIEFWADEAALLAFQPGYQQAYDFTAYDLPIPTIFLHLIPQANQLTVLIGYNDQITHIQGIPVSDVAELDIELKFKLLSDIIITRLETWCVAPSVYEYWQAHGKDQEILQAITYHMPHDKKNLPLTINMFSGLI